MVKNFWMSEESELKDLGNGIKRKIVAYSDNIMVCELSFAKDAVGALHSHPHEQATYILKGSFEFTIGDEVRVVKAGDCLYKQPNIVHGAKALEDSVLIDVFTPMREDFL